MFIRFSQKPVVVPAFPKPAVAAVLGRSQAKPLQGPGKCCAKGGYGEIFKLVARPGFLAPLSPYGVPDECYLVPLES